MLGIRLKPEEEERLERHARDVGRPKSVIVRDWIIEKLDRESVDALVAAAAAQIAEHERKYPHEAPNSHAWLEALHAEDGGYDWGPDGPPA